MCGDRISLQIAGKMPSMNRGLICAPNSIPSIDRCVARVARIRFFKESIKSNQKFHIIIGHSTRIAKIHCFKLPTQREQRMHKSDYHQIISSDEQKEKDDETFDFDADYTHLDAMEDDADTFILLSFAKSVCAASDSLLIGARFDNAETRKDACRLAFCGKIVSVFPSSDESELRKLRVYKAKQREGFVEKFIDSHTAIGANMFSKATNISLFVGLKVELETKFHEVGTIAGSFGDSGNFYIKFDKKVKRKRSEKWKPKILLKSRKFIFQKNKTMTQ